MSKDVRNSLSAIKVAEGLSLSAFVVFSVLPILIILGETLASTIALGIALPPSFLRYLGRVTANTLALAAAVTAVALLFGVPAGFFLARLRLRFSGFFLAALTIPLAAPSLVSALMIRSLLEKTGPLYSAAAGFGFILPSAYGFFGLAATQLLHAVPYTILLARAGFMAVPRSMEETAFSLGARPSAVFRQILIPFAMPHLLTACTMIVLYSLGDLGSPLVIGGGYKVFSSEIYTNFISNWGDKRVPLLFAFWAVVVFLAVLLIMAQIKTLAGTRRGGADESYAPPGRNARRVGVVYLVALSSIMLAPFLYALTRELAIPAFAGKVQPGALIHDWSSIRSTFMLVLFAVPAMLLSGIFIANALKRRKRRVLLTGLVLAPAVLPGVLLGFGLLRSLYSVEAISHKSPYLVFILAAALAVRGLPYVVIVLQSAVNSSTIPLEDTARSLGASSTAAFATVTLPQLRPFVGAAVVVGVFSCVTELSASLMIYPPGWQTMSMFIAYYMEEGFIRRALSMSFILIVVAESILALSGMFSARSARMLRQGIPQTRNRTVFLSIFTALEPSFVKHAAAEKSFFSFLSERRRIDALKRVRSLMGFFRSGALGRRSEIERLRAQNASLRMALAKADRRRLSMQINPHFFFNTLNTIVNLVQTDRDAAIATIGKLSSLFRYALDAAEADSLPLAKEIEYMRTYLEIERMRFGDKLRCTFVVPDELYRFSFPAMLIQPLLENAVKYGKDEAGVSYLFVSIRREGRMLVVLISDYGCGNADPEAIARSEGTGIRTVRKRLEGIESGSLRFFRNKPRGMSAEIRLPIEE